MGTIITIIVIVALALIIVSGVICYKSGFKVGHLQGYNKGSWDTTLKNMEKKEEGKMN